MKNTIDLEVPGEKRSWRFSFHYTSQGIQSTYTDSLYSMNLQHLIKHRHVATLFPSTHALRQISEAIRIYIL